MCRHIWCDCVIIYYSEVGCVGVGLDRIKSFSDVKFTLHIQNVKGQCVLYRRNDFPELLSRNLELSIIDNFCRFFFPHSKVCSMQHGMKINKLSANFELASLFLAKVNVYSESVTIISFLM